MLPNCRTTALHQSQLEGTELQITLCCAVLTHQGDKQQHDALAAGDLRSNEDLEPWVDVGQIEADLAPHCRATVPCALRLVDKQCT